MNVTRLVLSRTHHILDASGLFEELNRANIGACLWDAYPDGRDVFLPIYEQAWEDGHAYRTLVFRGDLLEVHANVCDDRLFVTCRILTVAGLEEALRLISAYRRQGSPGSPQAAARSGRAAPHLRAV